MGSKIRAGFSAHLLIPPDSPDNTNESFIHIHPLLSRCFDTLCIEALGEVSTLCTRSAECGYPTLRCKLTVDLDLTLILQITLISNHDDGEIILVLYLHAISLSCFKKKYQTSDTYTQDLLMES